MNDKQINFQKKTGIFLIFAGVVLFAIPLPAQRSMPMSFTTIIILLVLGSVFVFVGGYMHYRSRQHTAKNLAEKFTSENGVHDLLYLRPFTADSTLNKSLHGANIATVFIKICNLLWKKIFLKCLSHLVNLLQLESREKNYQYQVQLEFMLMMIGKMW